MPQRSLNTRFELKDGRRLSFYAALFNVPTVITERENGQLVTYPEVIRPGAFTDFLAGDGEVVADLNHRKDQVFAKRSDGTLLLQEDAHGLFCTCWVPETPLGDQIIREVHAGVLDGSSFQWYTPESKSRTSADGTVERLSLVLLDVCLTNRPAYKETKGEVHLRTQDRTGTLLARYNYLKFRLSDHT